MANLTIKQGDTYPPIEATLVEGKTSTPINLTEAKKVNFIAKIVSGETFFEGECAIEIETKSGKVTYSPTAENTSIVGEYNVEFKITWKGGGIESVPNSKYDKFSIIEKL